MLVYFVTQTLQPIFSHLVLLVESKNSKLKPAKHDHLFYYQVHNKSLIYIIIKIIVIAALKACRSFAINLTLFVLFHHCGGIS